jgi:ribonuclease T1
MKAACCRLLAAALAGALLSASAGFVVARQAPPIAEIAAAELPREARETLALIKRGGPFPYAKDGSVFNNRERLLPPQPRGYYREYTVRTPGARDRGARRIVAGGCPGAPAESAAKRAEPGPYFVAPCAGGEYYYTEDHYASFRRIRE